MTAAPAQSAQWMKYFGDIYGQAKPPVLGSFAVKKIEDKAREVMKDHLRECYHSLKYAILDLNEGASGIHVHIWECGDVLDRCRK